MAVIVPLKSLLASVRNIPMLTDVVGRYTGPIGSNAADARALSDAELVDILSRNIPNRMYRDYDRMLSEESLDAVVISTPLTYTMTVSNAGPSTATTVLLTNTLPAGVTFVSGSNNFGSVTPSGSTVVYTLGSITAGSQKTVALTALPTVLGQVTDTASVGSPAIDSNTTKNTASAKTVIIAESSSRSFRSFAIFSCIAVICRVTISVISADASCAVS